MRTLEHWVLRIADSDLTWLGYGWMRPARQQPVGFGYILFSSVLLGLPGVAVGAGVIYWFVGHVEPRVWLAMFALVMLVELPLHALFAHYWNRRAASLARNQSPH
jgi:amino acid permease